MTFRSLDNFTASLWDWGFLDGCFGDTKIRVGDVDGIVERGGEILVFEGKPMDFKIGGGQQYLWRALAKKGLTVLILFGKATDPINPRRKIPCQMQIWHAGRDKPDEQVSCDEEDVRRIVNVWYLWADSIRRGFRGITFPEFLAK